MLHIRLASEKQPLSRLGGFALEGAERFWVCQGMSTRQEKQKNVNQITLQGGFLTFGVFVCL